MKKFIALAVLSGSVFFTGCSTTHSVAISNHSGIGRQVTAKASHFNLLLLTPMSLDTSTSVVKNLTSQCGRNGISGVTTKTSSTYLWIGLQEQVEASAFCRN